MNFLVPINLNGNEIRNFAIQSLAADPASPVLGQMWYNSTSQVLKYKNATEIVTLNTFDINGLSALTSPDDGDFLPLYDTSAGSNVKVSLTNLKAFLKTYFDTLYNGQVVAGTGLSFDGATLNHTNAVDAQTTSGIYKITYDAQGHITASVAVTAADITTLLGNTAVARATADASGNVITTTYAPLASPALTGTPTAPTATAGTSSTQIATTAFVADAIATALVSANKFMGTLNAQSTLESTDYKAGMNWIVGTAGTYAGQTCEVGDWVYCTKNKGSAYSASDFAVVQGNLTNAVTEASTNTSGHIITGAGSRQIQDSGKSFESFVSNDDTKVPTSAAVVDYAQQKSVTLDAIVALVGSSGYLKRVGEIWDLDTTVSRKYSVQNPALTQSGGTCTWTVTHSLGTRDVQVSVYEAASPYEEVMCDISHTSTSAVTITIVSSSNIAAGTYKAVVVG